MNRARPMAAQLITQVNNSTFTFSVHVVFGLIGTFRLDYEYEIEYENDFSVLVCRLHIITTQTHLIPWASLST